MPIREPAGGGFAINRSFYDFGDVASLFMLETRLTARDHQLYPDVELPKEPTAAEGGGLAAPAAGRPVAQDDVGGTGRHGSAAS